MSILYALLAYDLSQPLPTFKDKLLYGSEILLIGMGTVFSVLLILMVTLVLFKFIFKGAANTSKKPKEITEAPTQTIIATPNQNEEIVAVIAAAIAFAESESNGLKFRVVSFKRK